MSSCIDVYVLTVVSLKLLFNCCFIETTLPNVVFMIAVKFIFLQLLFKSVGMSFVVLFGKVTLTMGWSLHFQFSTRNIKSYIMTLLH